VVEQKSGTLDLHEEPVAEHLESVEPGTLGGVVLSGLMEGSGQGERRRLLEGAAMALAPGGILLVHSLTPAFWDGPDAPPEADMVPARPYRPGTWLHVLGALGFAVSVTPGPDALDYLVVGRSQIQDSTASTR
jgi:surface antigen